MNKNKKVPSKLSEDSVIQDFRITAVGMGEHSCGRKAFEFRKLSDGNKREQDT